MTDVTPPLEKQIEQLQPKVEGAAEANAKILRAKDASPGTGPADSIAESEKLKLATSGKPGSTVESKVNEAARFTNPRHQKGADLEEAHARHVEQDKNNLLVLKHESPTESGFDNVYYDQKRDILTISEEKNLGSENKPGYVSKIGAWADKTKWENNITKLEDKIGQSTLDDRMKDRALLAIHEHRTQKELVVGEHTKVSDNKLHQYGVDRLVRFDPKDAQFLKVTRRPM